MSTVEQSQADPSEQLQSNPREQPQADPREQVVKFSAVLEQALDKPRLDTITMREQILSNVIALIVMTHIRTNAPGKIVGTHPPPMLVTTTEGKGVRAEVVGVAVDNYTGRYHMRIQIRGLVAGSDAEALLSLYEESKRLLTIAKRTLEGMGLYQPL